MSNFSGTKFHNDPVRSVGIAIQRNSGILKFQRKNFEILTFFDIPSFSGPRKISMNLTRPVPISVDTGTRRTN